MKKIKVLHVIPTLGAGGAERLINDLLPIFNRDVYEVELFVINIENAFFIDRLIDSKLTIHTGKSKRIKSFQNLWSLCKIIKSGNYGIIHGHLFPVNYWLATISFLFPQKKFIFTEHSTHNRRRDYKIFRPIERKIYGRFIKIISISYMTQYNLMKWLKVKNDSRFVIINNGVDIDYFCNAQGYEKNKLSPQVKNQDFLLLMVGRFTSQKDQETIIKSLPYISDNIKLILVGDGPRKETLLKITKDLELENRVIFLGLRDDVAEINKTVDVIIVSSKIEGFGLVAVEAMASGKPLISSKVPGLTEVTENYGQLFEQGNVEQLAELIMKLYNSEDERTKWEDLSSQGSIKYSIEIMCQNYEKVYDK